MPESETIQRSLTVDFLTKRRLNVPAIWLRPEGLSASAEDAVRVPEALNTDLNLWTDARNVGVRLVDGFIELRLKTTDDVWTEQLFRACAYLRCDTRAAYGPRSAPVSSILFHIDDPGSIDDWRSRWPRGGRDTANNWIETSFAASELPTARAKPLWRDSSPLPGSHFKGHLIVWRPNGKPEAETIEQGVEDLEPRPIAPTTMQAIVRSIAYATLSYWIQVYLEGLDWDASLTRTIGAWLARLVREGRDINAQGKSLEGVCWSPIDSLETATQLLDFLEASSELRSAFIQAAAELERNPLTPVAGWGSIETLFGVGAKQALRRAFRAGLDIDAVEHMAERYIYNTSTHTYLDRDDLLKGLLPYEHKRDELIEDYENRRIFINGKPYNPFRLYSASSLRTDVQRTEFFPGQDTGAILRFSRVHGLLKEEQRTPDDYSVLNTFPGFAIKPVATPDPIIMAKAISMLDRMLSLLTQDNDAQILWLKKFIAHIAQRPQEKPQVCPIIVGGQGIGKSICGKEFMSALFGELAGSAAAADLSDNKFLITPFIGKLITFIDEVRLESIGSINAIKKLVRAEYVSGQVKFGHQRDYYIPSRLLIASNYADIGLSPDDAADRAFFFIVAWTAENRGLSDWGFQQWALDLKGFYKDFTTALESVIFKQHLMRYFTDLPDVSREELENLEHSSRNDESVLRATMSKARDVARQIIADGRIYAHLDITAWFNVMSLRGAIKRIDGDRSRVEASQVLMEYKRADVVERMQGDYYRFRWGYGRLLQKLSDAHNLPLDALWPTGPGDFEDNEIKSFSGAPAWRGLKYGQKKQDERFYDPDLDPDHLDPF